tara:strand:- start:2371 stop:3213 length:843 start_codon:yes stop_codon:yes gene_type:complete
LKNFLLYGKSVRTVLDLSIFGFKITNIKPDIHINITSGNIPGIKKKDIYKISDQHSHFYREGVGLFEVINGQEINIICETTSHNLIAQYLINFPLALCFSQKNFLVLHASAVKYKNKVIAFCGKSHSGKSTTSALFHMYGGSLLTEDIAILDANKDYGLVPSEAFVKLSGDSAEDLGIHETIKGLSSIKERKYFKLKSFSAEYIKIDNLFFLNWGNKTQIKKIKTEDVFKNLYKFSYLSDTSTSALKILRFTKDISFNSLIIEKRFSKRGDLIKVIDQFI